MNVRQPAFVACFRSVAMFQSFIGRSVTLLGGLAALSLVWIATAGSVYAQDRHQNTPGEFDYYVLSLFAELLRGSHRARQWRPRAGPVRWPALLFRRARPVAAI